jgi:hypothetical protein
MRATNAVSDLKLLNRSYLYAGLALVFGLSFAPASAVAVVVAACTEASLRSAVTGAASGELIDMTGLPTTCKIVLTSVIPVTQTNLYFEGPAGPPLVTISGNNTSRVFDHTGTGQVVFTQLNIIDGNVVGLSGATGGCINSTGSVILNSSSVSGCFALGTGSGSQVYGGGVYAAETLTTTSSTVSHNRAYSNGTTGRAFGGGVSALNLVASFSTFSGNSVGSSAGFDAAGGGINIAELGAATISYSTIDNNSGGALFNCNGNISISNSTISSNTAYLVGGIDLCLDATLHLTNSTVAFNSSVTQAAGAGIYNVGGHLFVYSSIVADNTVQGTYAPSDIGCSSNAQSVAGSNNIIGSLGGCPAGLTVSPNDPQLTPLSNHGGPTRVHALLATSPAVGEGSNTTSLNFDQRGSGYSRFSCVLSTCTNDIGAYERQQFHEDEIFYDGFLRPGG